MRIRFLLGPAGSGKTFRCLSEIRDGLRASAEGPPLILLAPKQATFQLERQLLADGALPGYTRLRILSFARLAEFVFDQLGRPVPELLAEEGRVMVLRALLEQKRNELRVFRSTARLPGFARQLSQLLREFQNYRLSPARLESLAERSEDNGPLSAKLQDLALILRAYLNWLTEHQLEDADRLLDFAADALLRSAPNQDAESELVRPKGTIQTKQPAELAAPNSKSQTQNSELKIAALWLDGFAQMTPQERHLLAAAARCADVTTMAFCLDAEPHRNAPWHSAWAPVTETFFRCRDELRALPGVQLEIETLQRNATQDRFQNEPVLQHLERSWNPPTARSSADSQSQKPSPAVVPPHASRLTSHVLPLRLVACVTPEAEAEFAAREIRRYVRENGGRFRDVAVLLRSLDSHPDALRRAFARYGIPFFLDRRESVAHHPLAELTRYALRLAAYGWEHEDWFGALKTGLVHEEDAAIDRLENEALAHGWRGRSFWVEAVRLDGSPALGEWVERLRQRIVPPFQQFATALTVAQRHPAGKRLAGALRELWQTLKVARQLERWSSPPEERGAESGAMDNRLSQIHETVWEQMNAWLRNLELAFSAEALPLTEWLPIIESGLANLSVGVIPPALDQVLVGAIDRSRNPDLQVAFVLGVNEGLFPAPPPAPVLLNRTDRERLASWNAAVGPDYHQQIGLERYYGYIAFTRARRQLTVTCAHRDAEGRERGPSPFLGELQRLFPGLEPEEYSGASDWCEAEHWSELIVPWLQSEAGSRQSAVGGQIQQPALLEAVPMLESVLAKWEQGAGSGKTESLPPALVEQIYGRELRTSVSGLEDFAACPFKFFANRGLRAEERIEFELDLREKGSFQHEVLKTFHLRLAQEHKRWRDLSPAKGRSLVREVGEEVLPEFREGLFDASNSRRFAAHLLLAGLERLMETLVVWAAQYQFDPAAVETSFGLQDSRLPAWRLDLDGRHALLLRGRIDRIDVCRVPETGEALGVVIDYKSSAHEIDPVLLHHGLELQLLAYLGALSRFDDLKETLGESRLVPAGAFYVSLKGGGGSAHTRQEEQQERDAARRAGAQHRGRFDGDHLNQFDQRGEAKGDQFRYSKNKDGAFSKRGNEALPAGEFHALIAKVEQFLQQHGRDIYAGNVNVSPYRWKQETACDLCLYRAVCRFDPWTQPFRVLRPPRQAA